LLETSHALKPPREKLMALHEARQVLGRLLSDQEALLVETRAAPTSPKLVEDEQPRDDFGRRGIIVGRGRYEPGDEAAVKRRDLADRQGRLELAAHEGLCLIKPHVPDVAELVLPVEAAQREVQIPLRASKVTDAAANQEQAIAALKT